MKASEFESICMGILGMNIESMAKRILDLESRSSKELVEWLEMSREKHPVSTPTIETKRLMAINELIKRGDEYMLLNEEIDRTFHCPKCGANHSESCNCGEERE